jgi:hypothetical protein
LTPTPPTLHNDALLARAKAEHAIADHCILQRIIDRYAHATGAQAGITVEARRRADQQDAVARELEREATIAETAAASINHSSLATGNTLTLGSQLHMRALSAHTSANKHAAAVLEAQHCADDLRGRSISVYAFKRVRELTDSLQRLQDDADAAEAEWHRHSPGSPPIPRLVF